jgi:hypothetical protein
MGYALMMLGLGVLGLVRMVPDREWGTAPTYGAIVGGSIVAVGVGTVGRNLSRKGRKLRAAAVVARPTSDPRRPIVYLRRFADDEKVADAHLHQGFFQLRTEEEQIAVELNRIGPFVAIGDPKESLPDLGATRIYVGDGDWQARVFELMASARLVVLRVSSTTGVRWELQQAVSRLPPERLLLFVPKGRRRYPAVKAVCDDFLARPLPALPWRPTGIGTLQGIIRFDDDWTPEFLRWPWFHSLRASLSGPLVHRFHYMLRPVFARVGVQWVRPPLNAVAVAGAAVVLAIVVYGVATASLG